MPKFTPEEYRSAEEYEEALGALHGVAGLILFEFARQPRGYRDTIIRNFTARTDMTARAVFKLWKLEDFQDCWILHRCMLDRLFHLADLHEKDGFEAFEAWSFLRQYDALNRVRSDPEFRGALAGSVFEVTPEQKARVKLLRQNPPSWCRPKAEDVAKRLDVQFLYSFGYDYASTHVHPMANDGEQDFHTITKLLPAPEFPDQRSVLSNTLLVATMVLQQGLNASTLSWVALVYDFLDDLRKYLGTGAEDFEVSFAKLAHIAERGIPLAKAPDPPPGEREAV